MTTREDREAAADLYYIDHPTHRASDTTRKWIEGTGGGYPDDRMGLRRHTEAFATRREAAGAAERERIAKRCESRGAEQASIYSTTNDDANARAHVLWMAIAAEIRSGT